MGMFNYLIFEARCPFCEENYQHRAEMRVGYLNLDEYKIGDQIRWKNKDTRLPKGNLVAEGYIECSKCNKDFWIDIIINEDIVLGIKISNKHGYIQ